MFIRSFTDTEDSLGIADELSKAQIPRHLNKDCKIVQSCALSLLRTPASKFPRHVAADDGLEVNLGR